MRAARGWCALAVVVGAAVTGCAEAPATGQSDFSVAQPGDIALLGGTLFAGTSDDAVPNPGVLIRNGTIAAVGLPAGTDLSAARRIELDDDAFVMAGLVDLHAHYAIDLFGEGRVDEYRVNPVVFLANGVTSTFPAGEIDPAEALLGRERIAQGEQPGPRIFSSGPYFGSARPGWSRDAMTPDSIRREVDFWALQGVTGFKAKGVRPDQLAALIGAAHRNGLPVTGHLDSGFRNSVNPRDAILMGIDRIEHFLGGDALPAERSAYASLEELPLGDPEVSRALDEQIARFVRTGTFFDATLTAYGYYADREPVVFTRWADEMGFLTPYAREVVEAQLPRTAVDQFERIYYKKRETVKRFFDGGGAALLTLGTDHPSWGEFLSGFSAHRELHAMVLAGIPEAAALRAGTINAARALGAGERIGTVQPGKYADLIVVRGNPLAEITDTRNVTLVIKGGEAFDPEALFESVRGRMGPESAEQADWWKGRSRIGR